MHLANIDRTTPNPVSASIPALLAAAVPIADRLATAPDAEERRNRYARWALHEGLVAGDVVVLLMRNQPDVLAIWQGLGAVGVTVMPLDPALRDAGLAGRLDAAAPRHLIVEARLAEALGSVQGRISVRPVVWWHGGADFARIDLEIEEYSGGPLDPPNPSALEARS